MSTPQPPVDGEEQRPAEGTPAATARRAPRRTTSATEAPSPTGASASRKPVAGAAKAPAAKTPAAKAPAAKTATGTSAAKSSADSSPAAKSASRRPAAAKAEKSEQGSLGDVPSILETALAGHNASTRASVDAVETSAIAAPSAATPPAPADTSDAPTAVMPPAAVPDGPDTPTELPPAVGGDATSDGTAAHPGYPRSVTDFADRLDDTRFFSSLFDFSFTNYVTRKLAGPVYVVGLALIALSTLLSIIYSLTLAVETHSVVGAFVFLFGLIITLVGTMLAILLLRVGIEVFVAIIEIAQNTRGRKKDRR